MIESWFPKSYKINENTILKRVIFSGDNWQIYRANDEQNIIIIKEKLSNYWFNLTPLKHNFKELKLENETLYYFVSSDEYLLIPLNSKSKNQSSNKIISYEDALAFAKSLSRTRSLGIKESFENSIYIEKLCLILPLLDSSDNTDDKLLLGSFLSGGVNLSVDNKNEVRQLMYEISKEEFDEILKAANLEVNDLKTKTKERNITNDISNNSADNDKIKQEFSLPGRIELEKFFKDYIIDIVENQEYYKPMGIDFPSAFILQGPSGCGKTYAVEKLTEYLEWPCYFIDSGTIGSSFIHETSKKISQVFDEAIMSAPSVIVIDEMESFLSSRDSIHANRMEEVGEFLRRIPEAKSKQVLVIAMTNMIGTIDPAIKRKGRFDNIIEVGLPTAQEIEMVIDHFLKDKPHENIDSKDLSKKLVDYSLADVNYVMRESARITAKNHLTSISQSTISNVITSLKAKSDKKNKPGFKID